MHRTGSGGAGPSTGPRKQRILPHPSTLIEVTPDDEILFRERYKSIKQIVFELEDENNLVAYKAARARARIAAMRVEIDQRAEIMQRQETLGAERERSLQNQGSHMTPRGSADRTTTPTHSPPPSLSRQPPPYRSDSIHAPIPPMPAPPHLTPGYRDERTERISISPMEGYRNGNGNKYRQGSVERSGAGQGRSESNGSDHERSNVYGHGNGNGSQDESGNGGRGGGRVPDVGPNGEEDELMDDDDY